MDNSIFISLSRQLTLFRDMSVTANNIANSNTTGYNSEHILFNSYLVKDVNQKNENNMSFAYDISSYHNMENAPIKSTGNPLDLAIASDGFFAIETPLGIRYTKAGNFQLNATGTLVTTEGNPVLGNNGQFITFPTDVRDIRIGAAGNISVNDVAFASIDIFRFSNPQLLERLDGTMFKSEIAPEAINDGSARVVQGALSSSNVKPIIELTHMMEVSHSVTRTAKFIETMYDLQRKAASTWAQQSQ